MTPPNLSPEAWATIGVIVALVVGGMIGKVWRPVRKTVAAVDVLAGRPARYPGDPEERPGLAERLDRVDDSIEELRTGLAELRKDIETECPE